MEGVIVFGLKNQLLSLLAKDKLEIFEPFN
jgi:hypothetical protein